MRAIWVDAGNDGAYAKLKAQGITDPYYDIRDTGRVTTGYLQSVAAKGFNPGLYICSQGEGWRQSSTTTPRAWADFTYQDVQKIAGPFPQVPVCLNCETHDVGGWVVPMLQRWRAHSPKRKTFLAIEGGQGGIYAPHVKAINALGIHVVVELFHGDMKPQSAWVMDEAFKIGFAPGRLWAFHDAGALPWMWWGMAFTQGRLP